MQNVMTAAISVAALFFSFMCALLLEEFLFGGLFRLLPPLQRHAVRTREESDLLERGL